VAKRLIGSGCRLGGRSAGSKDEASRWGGDRPTTRGNFGDKCGASHCNFCGVVVRKCVKRSSYLLERWVEWP